ncbi:hypothetical protein HKX48_008191 [Thoreauomyces humboldtii]|nr:hypothetical protein HKX48_008191 [Thoreauomyces humboldtii]
MSLQDSALPHSPPQCSIRLLVKLNNNPGASTIFSYRDMLLEHQARKDGSKGAALAPALTETGDNQNKKKTTPNPDNDSDYDLDDDFIDDSELFRKEVGYCLPPQYQVPFFACRGPVENYFEHSTNMFDRETPANAAKPKVGRKRGADAGGNGAGKATKEKTRGRRSTAAEKAAEKAAAPAALPVAADAPVSPGGDAMDITTPAPPDSTPPESPAERQRTSKSASAAASRAVSPAPVHSTDDDDAPLGSASKAGNSTDEPKGKKRRVSAVSPAPKSSSRSTKSVSADSDAPPKKKRATKANSKAAPVASGEKPSASDETFPPVQKRGPPTPPPPVPSPVPTGPPPSVLRLLNSHMCAVEEFTQKYPPTAENPLPPDLVELLYRAALLASEHDLLNETFFNRMDTAIPLDRTIMEKVVHVYVIPKKLEQHKLSLRKLYDEFKVLVDQGVAAIEVPQPKFEGLPPTPPRFTWAPPTKILFWQILCGEWEMADLDNDYNTYVGKQPNFTQPYVRKAIYNKVLHFWPEGIMTLDLLSRVYSTIKKRIGDGDPTFSRLVDPFDTQKRTVLPKDHRRASESGDAGTPGSEKPPKKRSTKAVSAAAATGGTPAPTKKRASISTTATSTPVPAQPQVSAISATPVEVQVPPPHVQPVHVQSRKVSVSSILNPMPQP